MRHFSWGGGEQRTRYYCEIYSGGCEQLAGGNSCEARESKNSPREGGRTELLHPSPLQSPGGPRHGAWEAPAEMWSLKETRLSCSLSSPCTCCRFVGREKNPLGETWSCWLTREIWLRAAMRSGTMRKAGKQTPPFCKRMRGAVKSHHNLVTVLCNINGKLVAHEDNYICESFRSTW